MPEIRQRLPARFIHAPNCAANTPAKSPLGTLRMPSGALFSSSTWPLSSSRAPRSELVPQSTAISGDIRSSRHPPGEVVGLESGALRHERILRRDHLLQHFVWLSGNPARTKVFGP